MTMNEDNCFDWDSFDESSVDETSVADKLIDTASKGGYMVYNDSGFKPVIPSYIAHPYSSSKRSPDFDITTYEDYLSKKESIDSYTKEIMEDNTWAWVARDKYGAIHLFTINKPYRDGEMWSNFKDGTENCTRLPNSKFSDLTWECEPRAVSVITSFNLEFKDTTEDFKEIRHEWFNNILSSGQIDSLYDTD